MENFIWNLIIFQASKNKAEKAQKDTRSNRLLSRVISSFKRFQEKKERKKK